MTMKVSSKMTWACVLACAVIAGLGNSRVSGETPGVAGNPYSVISDRNVFHLNPPPLITNDAPKAAEMQKVMLTGFVGKGNSTRVLMAVLPKDTKEFPTYLNLAQGERSKNVELVSIRLNKEEIDIINDGTPMTLSVKSNSYVFAAPHSGGAMAPAMLMQNGNKRPGPVTPPPMAQAPGVPAAPTGGSAIVVGEGNSDSQSGSRSGGAIVNSAAPNGGGYASSAVVNNNNNAGLNTGGGAIVNGATPNGGGYGSSAIVNNNNNTSANAGALFNSQTGQYQNQTPNPAGPAAPREVQAAILLVTEASGGPPAPPSIMPK
jgi:hypothetical protein